ncbi:MAG: tetratricopeptide repeat protein [Planctomycetes bacterium]|nr:tetratricopeptide repeat protein [Planctomycetota bacterium]
MSRNFAIRKTVCITAISCQIILLGGCAATNKERKVEAEQHWNQVRGKIKLQLARQQFEHGQVDDAVSYLEEALGWDTKNAQAFLLLAECRLSQGKIQSAQRAIEHAVALDGQNARFRSVRGMIAERTKRYEDALTDYRMAREIDDTVVSYLMAEAECLVAMGRASEALRVLEANDLYYDNDPSLLALMGEIALRQGDDERAEQAFRAVLATGHYTPVIAEEYALLAVRAHRYTEALTVLQPLLDKHGDHLAPSVVRAVAKCMLELNRSEAVKMTLRKLLKKNPEDLSAWILLAKAGIKSKDMATARRGARNAERLAPNDPQTLLVSAYVNMREKRFPAANRSLRKLIRQNDRDVLAHCLLGLVSLRTNDLASAKKHYRRALSIDPGCHWAKSALQQLSNPASIETPQDVFGRGGRTTEDARVALGNDRDESQ